MTLKTKLVSSKVCLAVIPVAVVAGVILWQTTGAFQQLAARAATGLKTNGQTARDALIEAGQTDLTHVAESVYAMCQAQQELLQQKVDYDLNVARAVMQQEGAVAFAEETATWQAINQYDGSASTVTIPKMLTGQAWLGQNGDIGTTSPVVDRVRDLVGGTCTVFQRMNEAGDMLRVCTNVQKKDNTRAIGTYIPARNPDGAPNPVVASALKGETYRGRAFVVDGWYITAYEPIRDSSNRVVGLLYVGVKEESATALRRAIMDIKVGQTGYVYVLNATGSTRGHYVISKGGTRDGEDIWKAKDADGRLFIQDICAQAPTLKSGEIGETRYPWQNAGDAAPRDKVVKLAYFAPWDWVIGVGSYEDEFFEAANQMDQKVDETLAAIADGQRTATASILAWAGGIGLATLFISVALALAVATGITKPLNRAIAGLTDGAEQVNAAAGQVSSASQQLAEGASEQASALEETSSALEQMA
ncbi:MAG: methyl-accepting chemotaxis protein, partial [Planctomycetes bacterium]|nr:methyl-accepting chemotaxis protein [Planctomycetota bacterium]